MEKNNLQFIKWFEEISITDIPMVGGKNASLGEMFRTLTPQGIKIPPGFAVTADAFSVLIAQNGISEKKFLSKSVYNAFA